MSKPIFFDARGTRRRWSLRSLFAAIAALVIAAGLFAMTILNVPSGEPLPIRYERAHATPVLVDQVTAIRRKISGSLRSLGWLPKHNARGKPGGKPLSVGFYVPWDDASRVSLSAHMDQLNWVVPAFFSIGPDHKLVETPDPRFDLIMGTTTRRPAVLPMLQNIAGGNWDGAGMATLMHDVPKRRAMLVEFADALEKHRSIGAVFDLESLPENSLNDYRAFLADARRIFAPRKLLVTVTVPAGDEAWDLRAFAKVSDRVFLMNYDEHWQGGTAGPIASQPWFLHQLRNAVATVGRDKLIVAYGSYGYDWHGEGKDAHVDALTIEEAWLAAHDSGAKITFDPASGNTTFAYNDGTTDHHVWMLDATAVWNQLRVTHAMGVNSVALWRLGSEDPGIWAGLAAWQGKGMPDLSKISPLTNVDVEGNGEILRIAATPADGSRTVRSDANRLIRDVNYTKLPTPFIVQRVGDRPKELALTFDDGPDGTWTPKILDILKAKKAVGTFFIVGENAIAHPLLMRRIVDEGSEIGNHSYTHPNMALASPRGIGVELNATQRLIQAYTGRGTRLFRAPYFGDAEPTTEDELFPALQAQERGYTIVGLHVDPNDWQRPGVDAIVNQTVDQVLAATDERSGNVILLHDGGGDRSETVIALPRIIDRLREKGYSFVPVSRLAGLSREQVMPSIAGNDLFAVRVDVAIFAFLAFIGWALKWMFFLAISLGIARAILMAGLAMWNKRRELGIIPPPFDTERLVSVIIPAWNEERVIVSSITRVLASTDARIEVIVADDGSIDGTSAVVAAAFGSDPRVQLLTLANGGKAEALNRALTHARGEIIVALDADTQFEKETVARLVRWFDDPQIGAVAGNAKVGNRVNLVTRWQAVEYVTAQNVERRALAQFDAMMVVPGAVGAWRRAALDEVGGYPIDTLAEDQDLTIAIQRAGWRIAYDVDAVAWTESPESFTALAKQRFRWAFGTLQCLFKHRSVLRTRKPRGLATVGMPQAWLFQILFAAVSPVIDLALIVSIFDTWVRVSQHGWAQTQSDVFMMGTYWIAFTTIDVLCGWIAYRLEPREPRYPAHLLIAQRFVYRQVMYWVVLKAIGAAISGLGVGWGKQERTGSVEAEARA
ncbi:glycosyltransferase [Sphingomonas aliaeris]|uniref:Chitooligosaccharide deacetylase n=1 Tax=Sphingomonas aliaeris TaxID=2759526 RepID=A0A974NU92_9SPHN|nr:glycosyltransferase [Sphingomonas aliaeris]QQV76927.1 glycosyltransferase [Sphingomonas aliaeris]